LVFLFVKFGRRLLPEVAVDDVMYKVNNGGQADGEDYLIGILNHSHLHYLSKTPITRLVKDHNKDYETVNKLGNNCRAGSPEPQIPVTGNFPEIMNRSKVTNKKPYCLPGINSSLPGNAEGLIFPSFLCDPEASHSFI